MKIAYFDCIAGASGDMILGALVDAGLPLSTLSEQLEALKLTDFTLEARKVKKNAFSATKVDVHVADEVPERHVTDIIALVEKSDLPPAIIEKAVAIFNKIGAAEAGIHDAPLDHVHLHELGGVDTIVDVVGSLLGLAALGIERVVVSPIPLGRGTIRGAHGQIPLPAPATVALLKGVPIVGSPVDMETVTPTAAALLSSLGEDFGAIPSMILERVGYGAGTRDMPIPNVLRLMIGESSPVPRRIPMAPTHTVEDAHEHPHHEGHDHAHESEHDHDHPHPHGEEHDHPHPHDHDHPHRHDHNHPHSHDVSEGEVDLPHDHPHNTTGGEGHSHSCLDVDHLAILETNIDDLNPEFYEHVMARLFEAGALDVFFIPIQMKKNRPATLLRVLCRPDTVSTMTAILFAETSTLGIREHTVERHALPREIQTVGTRYGPVRVKVAQLDDGSTKSSPEY